MTEFFETGKTYAKNNPFRAPEDNPLFHCLWAGKYPDTGEKMAVGFQSSGYGNPWVPSIYDTEQFAGSPGWVEALQDFSPKNIDL